MMLIDIKTMYNEKKISICIYSVGVWPSCYHLEICCWNYDRQFYDNISSAANTKQLNVNYCWEMNREQNWHHHCFSTEIHYRVLNPLCITGHSVKVKYSKTVKVVVVVVHKSKNMWNDFHTAKLTGGFFGKQKDH